MSEETTGNNNAGSITSTLIQKEKIVTPLLEANEIKTNQFTFSKLGNIVADSGKIGELTVNKLIIADGESNSSSEKSETTENAIFNSVNLNFSDEYNCVYMLANENNLTSADGGAKLTIGFTVPPMGSKLVCRYLVLDLRNMKYSDALLVEWPGKSSEESSEEPSEESLESYSITWLYGVPYIKPGYLYVLAFQRFTTDLIVGNVAIKIEGKNEDE